MLSWGIFLMRRLLSTLKDVFGKGMYVLALVVLLNVAGWMMAPASYAVPSSSDSSLTQTNNQESAESREEAYEEAQEVVNDPKRGVEKEYEKNRDEYFQEHPGEGGVVQGAKNLVDKVTGQE